MIQPQQWLLAGKISRRVGSMVNLMDIMCRTYPKEKRFIEIRQALENGNNFIDILSEKGFEGKIKNYLEKISFKQATTILYYQNMAVETLIKKFLKSIGYQLLILVLSLFVLSLFTNKVLPIMMETVQSENTSTVSRLFILINILKDIILILFFLFVLFVFYIVKNKKETYLWMVLHKLKKDDIIKTFVTYQFVNDLKIYLENGVSLDNAINLIRYNKTNRMTSLLAYHFQEQLQEGNDILDCLQNEYFDDQFYTFCYFGIQADDFLNSLNDYKILIEEKTNRILREISFLIQIISYGFVGVVILLAYQALLLPLELLEVL